MIAWGFCLPLVLAVDSRAALAPGDKAAIATDDKIAFAVTPGARIEKTFGLEHELVSQAIQLEGDEEQISQRALEISSQVSLTVVDTYRAVEGGRPVLLQRYYRTAALHADVASVDARGEKQPQAWDAESPMRETSVLFTWVPEEKSYGRYFDEKESLEEYLAGLTEDLDYRWVLPGREVRPGDEWSIEPNLLVHAFVPGGNVPLGFVSAGGGSFGRVLASGVAGPLSEVFGGTLSGKARAKWKETREEDGVRLAVIEVTAEIETERDRTASARAALNSAELLEDRSVEHAGVKWKFRGEGTLLWNLTAGRFESFQLAGGQEVSSDTAVALGGEVERQKLSLAGSLKVTGKATAKK